MKKETNSTANLKISAIRPFRPKPWLRKNEDDKKVMGYYYVKKRHLKEAQTKVDKLIKKFQ